MLATGKYGEIGYYSMYSMFSYADSRLSNGSVGAKFALRRTCFFLLAIMQMRLICIREHGVHGIVTPQGYWGVWGNDDYSQLNVFAVTIANYVIL